MIFHYMQDSYEGKWGESESYRLTEEDRLNETELLDERELARTNKKKKYMNYQEGQRRQDAQDYKLATSSLHLDLPANSNPSTIDIFSLSSSPVHDICV